MKKIIKIMLLSLVLLFAFIINVSAETLNMSLVTENGKNLGFNVLVKDVKGNNNVFEGTINYDASKVSKLALEAVPGWEVYTKEEADKVRFIVFNMTDVAVNDTVLFKLNTTVKSNTDISIGSVGAAGNGLGVNISGIKYSYKEDKDEVNTDGTTIVKPEENPSLPEEENPNSSEEEKTNSSEEEIYKNMGTTIDSEEEKKNTGGVVFAIIVVGLIAGCAGLFMFRKSKKGEK